MKAVTLNTATGSETAIRRIKNKFDPDIETMEGAAFYYVCSKMNIRAIALRGISNMVEPRNQKAWEIDASVKALEAAVVSLINKIAGL